MSDQNQCTHTAQSLARYRVWMMDTGGICTADTQEVTRGCAWLNNRNKRNPRVSAPFLYQRFKCPDVGICRERGEWKCPTTAATATLRPPVGVTETTGAFLMLSITDFIKVYNKHWDMTGAHRSVAQNSARESCYWKKISLRDLTLKEISSCSTNYMWDKVKRVKRELSKRQKCKSGFGQKTIS